MLVLSETHSLSPPGGTRNLLTEIEAAGDTPYLSETFQEPVEERLGVFEQGGKAPEAVSNDFGLLLGLPFEVVNSPLPALHLLRPVDIPANRYPFVSGQNDLDHLLRHYPVGLRGRELQLGPSLLPADLSHCRGLETPLDRVQLCDLTEEPAVQQRENPLYIQRTELLVVFQSEQRGELPQTLGDGGEAGQLLLLPRQRCGEGFSGLFRQSLEGLKVRRALMSLS